jgi:hypothetical protein
VPVAVRAGLVVGRERGFVDDRAQYVVVAEAGVVGASVADEVDDALLVDDAVAQRSGQGAVSVAADFDTALGALGDGVVGHHTVHGAPGALVVAVVVPPVVDLDDRQALRPEGVEEPVSGQRSCH